MFVSGDGTLHSLLTAPYTFANATTAPEYGLSASGSAFTQVQLNPAERQGILMQVPFLLSNGIAPPVRRGLVVYKQLLCGDVPSPPANVPAVTADGPTTTTRERFATHAESDCAKGCHALFDPWGFAFENFDSLGHYRSQENGQQIDASGLPQADGSVGGPHTSAGSDTFQDWARARQRARHQRRSRLVHLAPLDPLLARSPGERRGPAVALERVRCRGVRGRSAPLLRALFPCETFWSRS